MPNPLHPDHPDAGCRPGDKRHFDGKDYAFGQNQYRSFWAAGPKDGTVTCSLDYPHGSEHPYVSGNRVHKNFEAAATRAKSNARAEYERAKSIVERYERKEKE